MWFASLSCFILTERSHHGRATRLSIALCTRRGEGHATCDTGGRVEKVSCVGVGRLVHEEGRGADVVHGADVDRRVEELLDDGLQLRVGRDPACTIPPE